MVSLLDWFRRPSTTDRLLDVLREDRAAQTALMQELVAAVRATADVSHQQLALLTAPTEAPRVRVMTDLDEAANDRARRAARETTDPHAFRTIDPTSFLAEVTSDIQENRWLS